MNVYEREDAEPENEAPLTVEELKLRRDELVSSVQAIEGQLSQKDRRDPDTGERMGDREFHEWRGRAVTARKHLLAELREVKAEIAKLESDGYATKKQEERELLERIETKLDLLLDHFGLTPTLYPARLQPAEPEKLYVVRLWDGFDGVWMDVSEPLQKAEAEQLCGDKNEARSGSAAGKRTGSYGDIDYYAVYPADTTMMFSGNRSQTGR